MPHGSVSVIVLALGIGAIYGLGKIEKAISTSEEATTRDSKTILGAKEAYNKRVQRLQKATKIFKDSAEKLEDKGNSLQIELNGTLAQLKAEKNPQKYGDIIDSIKNHVNNVLIIANERCNSYEKSLTTCQITQKIMQSRIDTLESALGKQVKVGTCHVLFVKCPSRTVVGITLFTKIGRASCRERV